MPYSVTGGHGPPISGAVPPDELDGRAEWVVIDRERTDLVDRLEARLGSEVDVGWVVLSVLCPLRTHLAGPPLDALLARLPPPLAREVRDGELNLAQPAPEARDRRDLVNTVATLLLVPPARAAAYVVACLGAARAALAPADEAAVAERLPRELAELWRAVR